MLDLLVVKTTNLVSRCGGFQTTLAKCARPLIHVHSRLYMRPLEARVVSDVDAGGSHRAQRVHVHRVEACHGPIRWQKALWPIQHALWSFFDTLEGVIGG